MNNFKTYHPIVNFLYFLSVIVFSMILMNPFCLIVSLASSFVYSIILNGKRAALFNFGVLIPLCFIAALFNAAFNHEGITILGYFPSGNPLTAESIIYGAASGIMMISVICWFSCFNAVMTSDKFIYLFGRIIPSLSLVLSMILRFVPRFKTQFKEVLNAQKAIGRDITQGKISDRIKTAVTVFSVMISRSLENSIETAESMKGRGYGLHGRTAFSIYTFTKRDAAALFWILPLSLYLSLGIVLGELDFRYFPSFYTDKLSMYKISLLTAYFLVCTIPIACEIKEGIKWKSLS